jgi:hypothetical protein
MEKKGKKGKRTVMLRPETHARLDEYTSKVIYEKRTTKVTFDDVVNSLLDLAEATGGRSPG